MANPQTYVKKTGTWRQVMHLYVKQASTWREVKKAFVKKAGAWEQVFQYALELTISANTTDYNIKTAAIAAGWDEVTPLNIIVTVASGVYVRASTTGTYAMDTGASYPVGTSMKIINNGYIQGKGGAGGAGGTFGVGTAGSNAGHAINLQIATTINNSAGYILGGGGGGGGGGAGDA